MTNAPQEYTFNGYKSSLYVELHNRYHKRHITAASRREAYAATALCAVIVGYFIIRLAI